MTFPIIAILVVMLVVFAFNQDDVTLLRGDFLVTIDGKKVEFNNELGEPYIIKETERTIVPIRVIAENMGYNVNWNGETKEAFIKGGGIDVKLKIGKNVAIVNGETVPIDIQDGKPVDTKAMLIPISKTNARTYVPIRFISEATGAKVDYKMVNGTHHITITTKDAPIIDDDKDEEVSFIEPDIKVTQLTDATHVSNYFSMRLVNRNDYKDTGINISTELTNWDDLVKYRVVSVLGPRYRSRDLNEYYSNWDYKKISGSMGRFYELGRVTGGIGKHITEDKPVPLPPEGYILKYKVTVTVGAETKVYSIDVPFHHKKFDLDNN